MITISDERLAELAQWDISHLAGWPQYEMAAERKALAFELQSLRSVSPESVSEASTENLGRFDHHPDPAIDFEIEVEGLQSRLFDAKAGISKPGTEPETVSSVLDAIERAMTFRVGGDPSAVAAKQVLRELEQEAKRSLPSVSEANKGVHVKPLGWGKTSYGRPEVETIVGVYRVFEHIDGGWAATFNTFNLVDAHGRKNFATEGEALAAAEADYRQRILSALDSGTDGQEPVAFNWTREMYSAFSAIQDGPRLPNMAELVALWDALHGAVELSSPEPKAVTITDEMVERFGVTFWGKYWSNHPDDMVQVRAALTAALNGDKP